MYLFTLQNTRILLQNVRLHRKCVYILSYTFIHTPGYKRPYGAFYIDTNTSIYSHYVMPILYITLFCMAVFHIDVHKKGR